MDRGSNSYSRFLSGDDSGMAEIITEYRDGLIFYLSKLVGSIEKAEELAEDTFVLLCVKKPKDRRKSSFKTWLYTIGRNISIDYLRREAKNKTVSLDCCGDIPYAAGNPEDEYIKDDRKKIVNGALKKLKSDYRQVLWLLYFENMSYREIAAVMKKSTHAAEMLAMRAREALKSELIKEGITDETY